MLEEEGDKLLTIAESSDCCALACVPVSLEVDEEVVVLVPACAIELYKPAALYVSTLAPDAVPSVATIPEVVDNALASSASPGSELVTTGELVLPLLVLVLVAGEYW